MKKIKVEMLWTAGMDSTFRLVQLSRMNNVEVQPYYVKGKRKSTSTEIKHMDLILDALSKKEATVATILKPIIIELDSIIMDEKIVEAHTKFNQYMWLGMQYKYLASFAKDHKGLEISIERDEDREYAFQEKGMVFNPVETNIGVKYVIDKDADKNAYTIFKDFTFPISTITKKQEFEQMSEWGYEDIIKLTWFCHNPIKDKPCGYCKPCLQCVEEGLSFRLDKAALRRNKFKWFYRIPIKINNFYNKLKSEKALRRDKNKKTH
ncbi:MAG: hypothetical protein J6V40_04400 [Clostridia bacterium]|nr:hypothetical protein [Clostridia bacterium]